MSDIQWFPNMANENEAAMCGGMNCPDMPYTEPIEISFLVVYLLGMSYLSLMIAWIVRNKQNLTRIDFEYLIFLCVGALFLMISLVLWPLNQNHGFCWSKPVFIALGTGIMFGTIIAKVYKVWYAFVRLPKKGFDKILKRQRKKSKLTKWELRLIILGITMLELVLLAIYMGVPDFRPNCECLKFENSPSFYSECNITYGAVIFLLSLNVIVVLACVYWAFQVHREFKRNKDTLFGKDRRDVDEFQPIIQSLAAVCLLGTVTAGVSVGLGVDQSDRVFRSVFYGIRAAATIMSVLIPVSILFFARKASFDVKQEERASMRSSGIPSSARGTTTAAPSRSTTPMSSTPNGKISDTTAKALPNPSSPPQAVTKS